MSRDAILFEGGQANLYVYVGNDPVNFTDAEGTSAAAAASALGLGGEATGAAAVLGEALPLALAFEGGYLLGEAIAPYVVDPIIDAIPLEWYAKKTGKERASDIPSWAKGLKKNPGESGKDFAKRLLDERFGPKDHPTGPGSDFNRLKKFGDRGCP